MADKKISQLPAATTPLAGTEVLPIVQSSTTDQVSVANLTAGRAVSAASLTLTSSPLPIASGGTNQTAFTAKSGNVAGLVYFDGTKLANDTTVTDVGYDTSTNTFNCKNFTSSGTTPKIGTTIMADITVQIGPDTPITTSSGRILFNTSSTEKNWFINHNWNTAGALGFAQSTATGGSTMAADSHTWDKSGNYTIVNGNLVIGTSGKGIDFSAVTHAGSTSKLLADYEEGTWTPTLTAATAGDLSVSYTYRTGVYRKVGKLVYVDFAIATSAFTWTTATGDLFISGLPFSVPNSQNQGAGALSSWQGATLPAGYTYVTTYPSPNTTRMYLTINGSAKANTTIQISQCPSGTAQYWYGSICYPVA